MPSHGSIGKLGRSLRNEEWSSLTRRSKPEYLGDSSAQLVNHRLAPVNGLLQQRQGLREKDVNRNVDLGGSSEACGTEEPTSKTLFAPDCRQGAPSEACQILLFLNPGVRSGLRRPNASHRLLRGFGRNSVSTMIQPSRVGRIMACLVQLVRLSCSRSWAASRP